MIKDARSERGAEERLDVWDRYARILQDQLASLEGDPDLERFQELAEQRELLAEEIDGLDRPLPDPPEADELLGRIRRRIAECRSTDRAVIDRLGDLRRETRRALGQMDTRRTGRAGYVPAAPRTDGHRVDVRS